MLPGNVERLHNDYRQINQYVIEKYQILPEISLPIDFQKEEIYQLYPFCVDNFLADMENDFIKIDEDEIFFFKKEMADEFINYATRVCVEEYQHLVKGVSIIDAYDYAWINKHHSLLETTQNTRDLGGYRKIGGLLTKGFSLIRSDVQNYPNEKDIEFKKMHSITTVIDMRGEKDIARKTSGFAEHPAFTYYNFQIDEGSGVPDSYEYCYSMQIFHGRIYVYF